jgi:UDP-glucose 4-epimerase
MKKEILITGGAGFIGSHLARRLLSAGHSVTVIDNLSTGQKKNVPAGATLIRGDLSNKNILKKIPSCEYDAVLHLAAQSSGEVSNEQPEYDLKVNTLSTLQLLKWCKDSGIPRFMYASSMAVYGDNPHLPVAESEPCHPLSFYGISKLSSEQYVDHFSREGLNTTCFRMFSVYGPGQNLTNMKQGMVSIFLAYLLNGEPVWVKGSGDRFRDFIFIDDVVDAWCASLDNPRTFGKIYNLATGKKTLIRELVEKEIRAFGCKPGEYPVKYEGNTPADQFGLYADITKITKDLAWKPSVDLDTGLKQMFAWAKKEYLHK